MPQDLYLTVVGGAQYVSDSWMLATVIFCTRYYSTRRDYKLSADARSAAWFRSNRTCSSFRTKDARVPSGRVYIIIYAFSQIVGVQARWHQEGFLSAGEPANLGPMGAIATRACVQCAGTAIHQAGGWMLADRNFHPRF